MAYGTIKVDTITFTDAGVDKSVTISGLVQNPTFSGNITVTGTISGNTVQGQTVSGATVTGNVGSFSTITGGTVTLTSGVFGTGTAAAPSIAFTGDSNTGIYSPGADQVAVATNGTGRLFIDASGNVLINDSASVTSNVTGYVRIRQANAASDTSIAIINAQNSDANATVKIQAGQFTRRGGEIVFGRENGGDLTNVNVADGYIAFSPVLNGANTERLRITSAGLVGIGTSSPQNALHAYHATDNAVLRIESGDEYVHIEFKDPTTTNIPYIGAQGNNLRMITGGAAAVTIDGSQRVGIGTTSPGCVFHVNTASSGSEALRLQNAGGGERIQAILGSTSTEMRGANSTFALNSSDGALTFQTGSAERARIDSSGRLGIGTSSPGALTHLSNTSSSTGYNFFQITAGSESQVHTIKSTISTGRDLEVNSARTLKFTTGSNTGAFASEGHFQFSHGTNGDLVRITADGKVGIGTTAPSQTLGVAGGVGIGNQLSTGTTGSIKLASSGGTNYIQSGQNTSNASAAPLVFTDYNAFNEWARIDSSGRLLVGTSTGYGVASSALARFQVGSSAADIHASLTDWSNVNQGGVLAFGAARGGALGNYTIVQNGDNLGAIRFAGADGTDLQTQGASIAAQVDGTPGANDMPGRLVFSTTADGASSPTERVRIDSSGNVGIGTTSPTSLLHCSQSNNGITSLSVINGNTGTSARSDIVATSDSADIRMFATSAAYTGVSGWADAGILSTSSAASNGLILNAQAGGLKFAYGATERARIDSSGRLLVGTSTAPTNVYPTTVAVTPFNVFDSNSNVLSFMLNNNSPSGNIVAFARRYTAAADGVISRLIFSQYDGTNYRTAAQISAEIDGTPGTADMPGRLVFSTTADGASSPTERLRIDSSGRVGIGTTSPGSVLSLYNTGADTALNIDTSSSSNNAFVRIQSGGVNRGYIGSAAAFGGSTGDFGVRAEQNLCFYPNAGSEKARIDTSGRLLVGTSSTSASASAVFQGYGGTPTGPALLHLCAGTATPTAELGYIVFGNSSQNEGATITAWRDGGTWTSGSSHPSRLVFSTTADGASGPTERMRITSAGVLITGSSGSTIAANTHSFYATQDTAATYAAAFRQSGGGGNGRVQYWSLDNTDNVASYFVYAVNSTANCFEVRGNGDVKNTNNSYGAVSDIKLKENIVDATSQWSDIKALQVRKYNFKKGPIHTQIGLIAQEVELVSPGLVSESPDRDEDGNDLGTVTKSVNYSVLYMKAVKALQEAMERIETLEGMVAVNNITIDEQQHQLSTLAARLTALESA
jgi:hypothetical protein